MENDFAHCCTLPLAFDAKVLSRKTRNAEPTGCKFLVKRRITYITCSGCCVCMCGIKFPLRECDLGAQSIGGRKRSRMLRRKFGTSLSYCWKEERERTLVSLMKGWLLPAMEGGGGGGALDKKMTRLGRRARVL
jgi:hypothetical protein